MTLPSRMAGKVAVVTGAAAGIGHQAARLFAAHGAKVVLADMNVTLGEQVTADLRKSFPDCEAVFVKTDVSKSLEVKAVVEEAESRFGKLNVMFNNAGIMHGDDGDSEQTSEEVWDMTMNVNVKGVWYGCKHGIPALRRAGGGSIINTASFVALLGAATPQLAYTASKGAVLSMTRELAVIHAKEGIRVNALCPGPVRTDLLMDFLDTDAKKNRRLVHVPMGRFGEADEMAQGALWLASDESSFVTGQEFLIDGGLTAAYVTPE